jgi:RNA polymerase sigma-70 factor, ECF subfamily
MTARPDLGQAFTLLRGDLHGFLRKRVGDSAVADDLLQDIFVKALASQHTQAAGANEVTSIENVTGWIYTIARNVVVDHYRATRPVASESASKSASKSANESVEDLLAPDEDDLLLHKQLANCLQLFIDQLDPIYRDTLRATELNSETLASLAQKENVSLSAIKSRAARGRAQLKDKVLQCCHVEMRGGVVQDYYPHTIEKKR